MVWEDLRTLQGHITITSMPKLRPWPQGHMQKAIIPEMRNLSVVEILHIARVSEVG